MEVKETITHGENSEVLNIPCMYVNACKINQTLYEFQLILGLSVIDTSGNETSMLIRPQALVHISPPHFKVLVDRLRKQLDTYEKEFGTISVAAIGKVDAEKS